MDLLEGELGSSNETRVTSTLDGNEVVGIADEKVSDMSEVADQETTTIAARKTEPNVQMAPALLSYKGRKDVRSKQSVMACDPMSINDLPDEILLNILSHFTPEDLCFIIAQVCERWNALAKDVALWRTLSYTCYHSSDINDIEEVLTNAPALHSLIIREREDVAHILEFQFRKHGDLRKLILKYCCLGEDSTGLVANIVALYPDLEVLSLEGCRSLTSTGYCLIAGLKKLSELCLSRCRGLNGKTVRMIVDSCQHLRKLSLCDVKLFDEDVIHVINKLGKQLTTLDLDWFSLTDVAFSYLSKCVRLQKLEVHYCRNMTDRGLLEGIGSLQELTSLRLNCFGALTAQALSTFLHRPSMTSIVSLNLSTCPNLDDEGLKGIAKRCINLKYLTVSDCYNVTDAGMSIVISHCNKLRVLNMGSLRSITGGFLALVPSHLPHLERLCLVGCDNVCEKYLEHVAAVPDLKVIDTGFCGTSKYRNLEIT